MKVVRRESPKGHKSRMSKMSQRLFSNLEVFQGVLLPLVAVPGLLGNLLSIAILRSPNIGMKVI